MTKLIFDCDPGVDDAVALFMAFAAPQDLELLAITTVAGNVGAELTARGVNTSLAIVGAEALAAYLTGDKARAAEDFETVAEEIRARLTRAEGKDVS